MRKVKTLCKRSFALFLAAVLCISVSQITVFAEDVSPAPTPSVSNIEPTGTATKPDDVVEGESNEKIAGNTPDVNGTTEPESGVGDDTDGSENPEPTPWTEKVGEEPNIVEVTLNPTATITPDGTKVTWSGTGESEDGKLHGKVEGEETTTKPTESSENMEIEIGDTVAGKDVNIEVTITTTGVDKNGVPKAPEGYGLKSDDGTTSVYTKVEDDGTEFEWIIAKISQTDDNGKTITTYQTTCGDEVLKWKVVETKVKGEDGKDIVIGTKTIKVVEVDGKEEEEVVSSTNGKKIPVVTTDVLQEPKPDDEEGYGEPVVTEEEGKKVYTKEVGDTIHKWVVIEIKDAAGNLIGYETTKSTETIKTEPWTNEDFEQTLKPEVPEGYNLTFEEGVFQKTENGSVLTWTRTEIKDEAGNIIGYKIVEVKPDVTITTEETLVDGVKITKETKSTITKETVTVNKDGKVDVTVGVVTEGANHGNLENPKSLIPNMKNDPKDGVTNTTSDLYGWEDGRYCVVTAGDGLNVRENANTTSNILDALEKGTKVFVKKTEKNGKDLWGYIQKWDEQNGKWVDAGWVHLGYTKNEAADLPSSDQLSFDGQYGLSSAVMVGYLDKNTGKEEVYNVHQYVVYDADGNKHYAYCADLSTKPNKVDYGLINIENSGYFGKEAAEQISAIAVNGYWGTASGTGSLSAFKDWLVEIGYAKNRNELSWISGGIAMSATQAAIWYYGSSGNLSVADVENPFVYYQYNSDRYQYDRLPLIGVTSEKETQAHVKEIYDFLINPDNAQKIKDSNKTAPTEFINANSVSKVSVSVVGKVPTSSTANDIDTKNNTESNKLTDVYSTDVSFYLDVKNSKINDDLIVNVFAADSGELLYTYRLENAEEGNSRDSVRRGIIKPNKDGSYTLKDLQLGNGVEVTLQITGTQTVSKGAYLISATGGYDSSQTFISVEEGERSFDLKMNIKLDVQKGEATVKTETHEVNSNETKWSWGSDSSVEYEYPNNPSDPDPSPGTSPDPTPDPDEPTPQNEDSEDSVEEIPEDPVPLTNIPNDPVPLANVPLSVELAEIPDEDVPLAGLTDIFDEDVPLADVPETGDISVLWYVLIFASGVGLLVLRTADAKKRKNSLTR